MLMSIFAFLDTSCFGSPDAFLLRLVPELDEVASDSLTIVW